MIRTTLQIDGMMCGHCEAHVNDAVRKAFSVKKVTSSHKRKETVLLTEEKPDETKLAQAIQASGYDVLGIRTEPYEAPKGLLGRFKK